MKEGQAEERQTKMIKKCKEEDGARFGRTNLLLSSTGPSDGFWVKVNKVLELF